MKRHLKLIPVFGIMLAAFFLMGFTDLPEDHWAYPAVRQLADEGTVSGFEDGSFKPDELVTRAEFVKMLGYRLPEPRNDYISDLRQLHWAYDNLLYSPLRTVDGKILADDPITREQVAVYIYDCYADGAESAAPSVITNSADDPVEVGWVYEHGVMVGDDGLNLRLSDGLTRAEAAKLIVSSRGCASTTTDFADNVPDEYLKRVFNSSALFDVDYSADAVLTNGQVARAAYRLNKDRVSGLTYNEEAGFEHEYANDLKAMEAVLGPGRISAEFADSPALPEDAFAMLAYGIASKIKTPVAYGAQTETFKDAKPADAAQGAPLAFDWQYGIRPYGGGVLKTGTPVTHRVIASVLLQYDALWGLRSSAEVTADKFAYLDEPMNFIDPPKNADVFMSVPASVPNFVADLPFRDLNGTEIELSISPRENFAFCYDLSGAFAQYLSELSQEVAEYYGMNLKLTYYPQLVYDSNGCFTLRLKAEVLSAGSQPVTADELFEGCSFYTEAVGDLSAGDVVWLDLPVSYSFFME